MSDHVHDGHRLRMKQRFLRNGLDTFDTHEVLELLLFFGIPRKDTNPLAHELIDRFGGLAEVLETDYERLIQVDGVTENIATLLTLMPQMARRYQQEAINSRKRFQSFDELTTYVKSLFINEKNERVRLLCLNNRGDLLNCSVISEGTPDSVPLNTRAIVETSLRFNATKALLAHNHPAGFAHPSDADIQTTIVVRRALDSIGIQLLDHLIISANDHLSMRKSKQYAAAFSSYALDDSTPDWLR